MFGPRAASFSHVIMQTIGQSVLPRKLLLLDTDRRNSKNVFTSSCWEKLSSCMCQTDNRQTDFSVSLVKPLESNRVTPTSAADTHITRVFIRDANICSTFVDETPLAESEGGNMAQMNLVRFYKQ
jgi:hypothetical protein